MVREKKKACGKFNFQIYENVSREHESSVKAMRVSRIFLDVFHFLHVRSALASRQTRAAGIRVKAISQKYMQGAIFDIFKEHILEASYLVPCNSTFKVCFRLHWKMFIRVS